MYPTFPTPLCGTIDRAVPLALPQTLHAQLFLLAYDRYRAGSTAMTVGVSAWPCAPQCSPTSTWPVT